MAFFSGVAGASGRASGDRSDRTWMLLALALLFFLVAAVTAYLPLKLGLWVSGGALVLAVLWRLWQAFRGRSRRSHVAILAELIGNDLAPSFVSRAGGAIIYRNSAAQDQLGAHDAQTLSGALQTSLANPGAILFRLEARATAQGAAHEDVVTRKGHLRLSVHRAGPDCFLWRVEKSADRPQPEDSTAALPMITLGRNNAILFMNSAARRLIGERVHALDRICPDMPLRSGEANPISTKDGLVSCFVVETEGTAGRREILLLPGAAPRETPPDGWGFFDALPVPLLKLAQDGRVDLSNRLARELLGVETTKDRSFCELTEGLGRSISDWLQDAMVGRGTVQPETLRVRGRDSEVFVQVTLNRILEDGQTALVAVLTDATKLKSLEEQFVQSQKMQAIGQLAGGVAHDFNNLLTAITGHCDLLLLRHDQGDTDYADLVQINQNANRAAALVGQLLAYSRKQTLRPEVIDLRDALFDLGHLLNRLVGEKVTLSLHHDPDLSHIRADKRQLEQVIMNLVVNARDAMPGGGAICIDTQNLTLDAPLERDRAVVQPGRYVSVHVSDEGQGIAPDKLQKVFEPFFTTKRVGEGTGLGLSTAYGIIKQSGGFIFVDSTLGEGTRFQILLPAHDPVDAPSVAVTPLAPVPEQSDGVILLVEDEAPVRAFASRALQLRGYTVIEADSAESALELLKDPDLAVDVFASDVVMPGIDGPSWVKEALKDRPDVRVVFMSGYAEETFGDTQSKIANSVFLPKPFSLTDLTETVRQQLV